MAKKDNKEDSKEVKKETKDVPKETVKETKKPPVAAAGKKKMDMRENFRGIVRIAGKDVLGDVMLVKALPRVRGISHTLSISVANVLHRELSLDPKTKVGELTDEQIEKIDAILTNLHEHKILPFLLNRRNDYETGKNMHVIMNDLIFANSQDIEREKKNYTWIGYRHFYGQKVRGQKTRNTGRTGMAVGVLRKTVIAAQGGAAAGAKPAGGAGAAAPAAAAKSPAKAAAEKAEKKPIAPPAAKK